MQPCRAAATQTLRAPQRQEQAAAEEPDCSLQLLPVTVRGDTVGVEGLPILEGCDFQHSSQQASATILGYRSPGPTSLHNTAVGQVSPLACRLLIGCCSAVSLDILVLSLAGPSSTDDLKSACRALIQH